MDNVKYCKRCGVVISVSENSDWYSALQFITALSFLIKSLQSRLKVLMLTAFLLRITVFMIYHLL